MMASDTTNVSARHSRKSSRPPARSSGQEADITGLIRIAAPIALSNTILIDMLAEFGLHYPEVQFDITQTNDHQHLFDNDRDLVFFNGELPQSLPNAICLGHIEYGLFASPLYLTKKGTPSHPNQLEEHDLIYCWPHQHWQLTDKDGQSVCIKRSAKLTVNQTRGRGTCSPASSGDRQCPAALSEQLPP